MSNYFIVIKCQICEREYTLKTTYDPKAHYCPACEDAKRMIANIDTQMRAARAAKAAAERILGSQ